VGWLGHYTVEGGTQEQLLDKRWKTPLATELGRPLAMQPALESRGLLTKGREEELSLESGRPGEMLSAPSSGKQPKSLATLEVRPEDRWRASFDVDWVLPTTPGFG
jgi:hypothetical protein